MNLEYEHVTQLLLVHSINRYLLLIMCEEEKLIWAMLKQYNIASSNNQYKLIEEVYY